MIEKLLQGVWDYPEDHEHKLVVADWLEDNHSPVAAYAWRWVAEWKFVPATDKKGYFWRPTKNGWGSMGNNVLPTNVYYAVLEVANATNLEHYFPSIEESYNTLVRALINLQLDLRLPNRGYTPE